MSTIKVKVANPLNKQVKQVTVGKVDASSINMNDFANVDTTTVSLQSGTTLIFDASTGKFDLQYYRWWDLLTILGENNANSNSDKKHRCFCSQRLTYNQGELAYSMDASNSGAGAILYVESQDSGSAVIKN